MWTITSHSLRKQVISNNRTGHQSPITNSYDTDGIFRLEEEPPLSPAFLCGGPGFCTFFYFIWEQERGRAASSTRWHTEFLNETICWAVFNIKNLCSTITKGRAFWKVKNRKWHLRSATCVLERALTISAYIEISSLTTVNSRVETVWRTTYHK